MPKYKICPTITASNLGEYKKQLDFVKDFARHVHIDLMDGDFAASLSPPLKDIWWYNNMTADLHLMFEHPMESFDELVKLKPNMVIIHNEVKVHHMHMSAMLHSHNISTGLAILQDTPIEWANQIMHSFDQVLVFSGHLGYHGGVADLNLLEKVKYLKYEHPDAEIAWDGGINDQNIKQLYDSGVTVFNVGGYIQEAGDPKAAYETLKNAL